MCITFRKLSNKFYIQNRFRNQPGSDVSVFYYFTPVTADYVLFLITSVCNFVTMFVLISLSFLPHHYGKTVPAIVTKLSEYRWPIKCKPHLFGSYAVNNTIFMFEETVVFCIYSCNHIVYVLLSNINYSTTCISTNWDQSTSSSRPNVCIILPIEVLI